jgi:protein-L-isoaspartate(D-aspartate) O-methyltransferase
MNQIEKNRFNMIEQQIRTWNVLDKAVLDLLKNIPREDYVPKEFLPLAFSDVEIPIEKNITMLSPVIEAKILNCLDLNKQIYALHVGTGSGYFAALLASQVKKLLTIDISESALNRAKVIHRKNKISNIEYLCCNGFNGLFENFPYDLIVFTASHLIEPPGLRDQLAINGSLLFFEGNSQLQNVRLVKRVSETEYDEKILFEASIPSLLKSWEPNKFLF